MNFIALIWENTGREELSAISTKLLIRKSEYRPELPRLPPFSQGHWENWDLLLKGKLVGTPLKLNLEEVSLSLKSEKQDLLQNGLNLLVSQ